MEILTANEFPLCIIICRTYMLYKYICLCLNTTQGEIGVFFPLIVLRPLDGSDFNHKMSVLRCNHYFMTFHVLVMVMSHDVYGLLYAYSNKVLVLQDARESLQGSSNASRYLCQL